QPGDDLSHRRRVERQPVLAAVFPREIDQDRLRVAQGDVAVLEDRDLAERVLVAEGALLVGAGEKIDGLDLDRQSEQRAEQANLVAIPRQFEVVKPHAGHSVLPSLRRPWRPFETGNLSLPSSDSMAYFSKSSF